MYVCVAAFEPISCQKQPEWLTGELGASASEMPTVARHHRKDTGGHELSEDQRSSSAWKASWLLP